MYQLENYVLQFNCTYTGVSFSGDFSTDDKDSLLDKVRSYFPVSFNLPYTLTLLHLTFTTNNKTTDLEGQIKLEYEKYIPISYVERIIYELTYEILGFFIIAGHQNGKLTPHLTVNRPKLELISATTLNPDLKDLNPSIMMAVRGAPCITLTNLSSVLAFKDYLNRPNTKAIQTAQFWLNIANSNNTNGGFSLFDNIKRFTNVWSAFNALYTLYGERNNPNEAEWKKIISFATSEECFKNYIYDYLNTSIDQVNILLELDLNLTNRTWADKNLSELYKNADKPSSNTETYTAAHYFMLILYALRNDTFHGNGYTKIYNGARVASDFIEGLVKLALQNELCSDA